MSYIAYTRVSTIKQGVQGVSLDQQRDAISRYAERQKMTIGLWLEEMETAAKQGRPIFKQALTLLKQKKAKGLIVHKLDRGVRNLKDWALIGDLVDEGIEVHFAHESLDMLTRGGRLAADIQAVVAADYIRNLRQETKKGIDGRLKKGLYPFWACVGYRDTGTGGPKTIDPIMGPLTLKTFELYATGRHTFETLEEEMYRRGLRNRRGGRVTRNGLSTMLNNPFYIGIIRIKKTGERYPGIHDRLISKSLFDRVQLVLSGKVHNRGTYNCFLFRRLLTCASCRLSLIAERKKGHVYYRCHSKQCRGTSVREKVIDDAVGSLLQAMRFEKDEVEYFKIKITELRSNWVQQKVDGAKSLQLQLDQIKDRLGRLTDAYLDKALDRSTFEERKTTLLTERLNAEAALQELERKPAEVTGKLENFLELVGNAWLSYQTANAEEKREMLRLVTSNRIVNGKNVVFEPSIPFREVANRHLLPNGGPERDQPGTLDDLWDTLTKLNTAGQLPDVSSFLHCKDENIKMDGKMKEWNFAKIGKN